MPRVVVTKLGRQEAGSTREILSWRSCLDCGSSPFVPPFLVVVVPSFSWFVRMKAVRVCVCLALRNDADVAGGGSPQFRTGDSQARMTSGPKAMRQGDSREPGCASFFFAFELRGSSRSFDPAVPRRNARRLEAERCSLLKQERPLFGPVFFWIGGRQAQERSSLPAKKRSGPGSMGGHSQVPKRNFDLYLLQQGVQPDMVTTRVKVLLFADLRARVTWEM